MRNPHLVVVNQVREVICGVAVRLEHHEVVHKAVLESNLAAHEIVDGGRAVERHFEAHDRVFAARAQFEFKRIALFVGETAAAAVVAGRVLPLGTFLAHEVKTLL